MLREHGHSAHRPCCITMHAWSAALSWVLPGYRRTRFGSLNGTTGESVNGRGPAAYDCVRPRGDGRAARDRAVAAGCVSRLAVVLSGMGAGGEAARAAGGGDSDGAGGDGGGGCAADCRGTAVGARPGGGEDRQPAGERADRGCGGAGDDLLRGGGGELGADVVRGGRHRSGWKRRSNRASGICTTLRCRFNRWGACFLWGCSLCSR